MNYTQNTGRILQKWYDEEKGELRLLLLVRGGRPTADSKPQRDRVMYEYTGPDALDIYESASINDRVTVIGHTQTRNIYRQVSGREYKLDWGLYFIADAVCMTAERLDTNTVILSGVVDHVYRKPEEGKRFYIVRLRIQPKDGDAAQLVSFTYFDRDMRLEPQVGDTVHAVGYVNVKDMPPEVPGGRTVHLTTVVARSACVLRRQDTAEVG